MKPLRTLLSHAFGLSILLRVTLTASGQTLHAILVADTQDPGLMTACQRDVATMHRQAVQVAAALGYPLREQVLSGADFHLQRLNEVLNDFTPGPDDVVLFYYTGHGYSASGRAGYFPVLLLEKNEARSRHNPGLRSVHERIKSKKPRLCITMGDCCNEIVRNLRGMTKKGPPRASSEDSLNAAIRTLFLEARGDVLIASSQPPQQACAHPDSGSFYTRAFDEALELAGRFHRTATWERVLRDAQTRLTRHQATQAKQSIYEVNVTEGASPNGLSVVLRTNRGRLNAVYAEGDTLLLEVKASRPCHLRLMYLLADGTRILLEDQVAIRSGQENQYLRLSAAFRCEAPFGAEYVLAYAAEEEFCPLPTQPGTGGYLKEADGYVVFVGSSTEMLEAVRCTKTGSKVTEDRLQITTRAVSQR